VIGSRSDAEQLLSALIDIMQAKVISWKILQMNQLKLIHSIDGGLIKQTGQTDNYCLSKLSEAGTGELMASFVKRITDSGYNILFIYIVSTGDTTSSVLHPVSVFNTEAWKEVGGPLELMGTDCQQSQQWLPLSGFPQQKATLLTITFVISL
jgi:hypothetical protein